MTLAPPPCAPSSRRHQVAPMVLNSHLAITKLDLIDGSENWNGGSTTVVQAATSLTLPGRSTTVVQAATPLNRPRQIHHRGSGAGFKPH
uniref:Uncharacterized protein n=1 Tax=Fagus sylvatica TaxID=28930 RepID=A0A2N9GWU6_FAGSY